MPKNKSENIESIKKKWDGHAKRYDEWYKTFEGAVEHYVDWELLKRYLPKQKNSKILDAAGGTGRITLPLAKMGYSVTLCDISPEMLDVARKKVVQEGVSDRVEIYECDVHNLPFASDYFDFVLCWDGMIEAAKELIRVTKKRGKISIFLMNKWGAAIDDFYRNQEAALRIIKSTPSFVSRDAEKHRAVSVEEARKFFEKEGIKVLEIYAVCGLLEFLSIPQRILESRKWDEKFFKQAAEMLLRWSKEPSVKGLSRHLVVYGEKI